MVESDYTLPLFLQADTARYGDDSACLVVSLIDNAGELLLSMGEDEPITGLIDSRTWDEQFTDALGALGSRLLAELVLHLQDEGLSTVAASKVASEVLNPDRIALASTLPSIGL